MAAPRAFTSSGLLNRFFGSAISTATGFAIGSALGPVLLPYVQDLANTAWHSHPVKPLPASQAAQAELRGILVGDAGLEHAKRSGYNQDNYKTMLALAGETPSPQQMLDLRRRGTITSDELLAGLERGGMLEWWRSRYANLVTVLPSVTDMVRFAVREVYNKKQREFLDLDAELPAAFVEASKAIGLTPEIAADYWAAHWELPSVTELAAMLFRDELSPAEFSDALKALDYAPTWRSKLEAILRPIPPLSDMIRFAVREAYNDKQAAELGLDDDYPPEFTTQAALHGMIPKYAKQYWRAHWRLPSALQGYRMLWRDEISPGELDGLLKALDYPAKWRKRLEAIAHIVPGRVDLRRMFAADILNRQEIKKGYQRIGYTVDDAELLTQLAEADAAKGGTAESWVSKARTRLFTVAHNEYLDGSLAASKAGEVFEAIGVPANERPKVLALWTLENEIARLELTAAQVKKAYSKAGWTQEEAVAALEAKGMTAEDAVTFLTS